MNILLGAYACEPNKGSEPEVGWQMSNEIAKVLPNDLVFVITRHNNKKVIEQEGYPNNLKFYYYDLPKLVSFWKKGSWGIRTYYYLWMIGAALFMKKQNIIFDIVHHVTFVNDWLPSFFALLKKRNNKFIWGPIGSHDPIAVKFLDGKKRRILERFRIFLQLFFRNLDPAFHYCKAKSDYIIGINENVKDKLRLKTDNCFIAEPAIGMKNSMVKKIKRSENSHDTFLIVSIGRLLYIKNFKLTILAFSEFLKNNPNVVNAKLRIIGDGKDRRSLGALVQKNDIVKSVEFVGKIPLHKVQKHFAQADIFLFPTLENAGFVILEAMSNALPLVAMDYGGPQQFIKHNIDKQLVSSDQLYDIIVKELAKNLERFYFDKKVRRQVGEQNRQDVLDHFTWEAKTRKIKEIYNEVINED